MSDEPLDQVAKTNVTKSFSRKINADMRPGRGRSDVIRDALEFYFEYRDRIIAEKRPEYGSPKKK